MDEALHTGKVLAGRYAVGERLGHGGWGSVYAAVHTGLGRPVAIKTLHTSVALAADGIARFEREAKAAAALGHPNIAQVSDFQANPGEPPFLVMELLTGETLGAAMRRTPRIAPARMAWIAYQILAGLEVAHRAGIVHRDIKPDNVFLVAMAGVEDFVKLLDFGIAKLAGDAAHHLTTTGTMLGSPAYMAPEQVRGAEVDHRADIYALGATMYLALSGRMAFEATTVHALLLAITEQPLVSLRVVDPSIDPALSAVVDRAMAKDPRARFESAAAMREALQPWLAGTPAHASGAAKTSPVVRGTSAMPAASMPAPAAPLAGPGFAPGPPLGMPPPGGFGQGPPPGGYGAGPALGASPAYASSPGYAPSAVPVTPMRQGPPPVQSNATLFGALAAGVVMLLMVGGGAAFFVMRSSGTAVSAPVAVPGTAAAGSAPGPAAATSTAQPAAATVPAADAGLAGAGAGAGKPLAAKGAPDAGAKTPFAGSSVTISGGSYGPYEIAPSQAAIMATAGGALRACYAATEFDPPNHEFTMWTFQVDPAGNVKSVGRTTDFEPHPKLDRCVIAALRQVKWAATPSGGSPQIGLQSRTRANR